MRNRVEPRGTAWSRVEPCHNKGFFIFYFNKAQLPAILPFYMKVFPRFSANSNLQNQPQQWPPVVFHFHISSCFPSWLDGTWLYCQSNSRHQHSQSLLLLVVIETVQTGGYFLPILPVSLLFLFIYLLIDAPLKGFWALAVTEGVFQLAVWIPI